MNACNAHAASPYLKLVPSNQAILKPSPSLTACISQNRNLNASAPLPNPQGAALNCDRFDFACLPQGDVNLSSYVAIVTDKSLRGLLSIKLVAASGRTPELLGEAGEAAGGVVAGVEAAGVVAAGGLGSSWIDLVAQADRPATAAKIVNSQTSLFISRSPANCPNAS